MNQEILLLTVFILLTCIGCCYGAYVVEVTLHSYSNPSGRCDQCQDGSEPGCCDEPFVRPAGQACPSNSTCDSFIRHCVEHVEGTMCDNFSFFYPDTNSRNLDNSDDALDNPVTVQGEEPWEGLRVAFFLRDCTEVEENHCVSSDQIDSVLIDIDTPPGTSSPERPYTGNAGITEFTVSYTVRCAGGYTGDACDVCTGLDCVYGVCVGSDNDLSCSCDLGFTGTRCQTVIGSPDPDKVPVGAIVGGVLGGSFLLCCVWTSLLCVVLVTRKRRNSSRAANISDSASAPYHAARFEETKVTNYQLELKDSK